MLGGLHAPRPREAARRSTTSCSRRCSPAIALLAALRALALRPCARAARVNERRARSLGFPIYRIRLAAFVIAGALAGLAGYFAAAQYGYVTPQMLGWHVSAPCC